MDQSRSCSINARGYVADQLFEVQLTVEYSDIVAGTATLQCNQQVIFNIEASTFESWCKAIKGKAPRLWREVAAKLGFKISAMPDDVYIVNQIKTVCMVFEHIDPFLLFDVLGIPRLFDDDILVEVTGRPGPQSTVYFLPFGYLGSQFLSALHKSQRLLQLEIRACSVEEDINITTYCVPLAVPIKRALVG